MGPLGGQRHHRPQAIVERVRYTEVQASQASAYPPTMGQESTWVQHPVFLIRKYMYVCVCIICIYVYMCVYIYRHIYIGTCIYIGDSDGKASGYNAGDPGSIPGSGKSPGEGNGNPLQYYCLENPLDWRSMVGYSPWGCKESDTAERLHSLIYIYNRLTDPIAPKRDVYFILELETLRLLRYSIEKSNEYIILCS